MFVVCALVLLDFTSEVTSKNTFICASSGDVSPRDDISQYKQYSPSDSIFPRGVSFRTEKFLRRGVKRTGSRSIANATEQNEFHNLFIFSEPVCYRLPCLMLIVGQWPFAVATTAACRFSVPWLVYVFVSATGLRHVFSVHIEG